MGANLWSRFQTLNHIQAALSYLDWLWLCIGGHADLHKNDDAAEHKATEYKNLDMSSWSEFGHRCFVSASSKWFSLMYRFWPEQ